MSNTNNKFKYNLYRKVLLSSIPVETGNFIITTDEKEIYADINGQRKLITKSSDVLEAEIALKADKADTYNKAEIDDKLSVVFKYKGSVNTYNDLPKTGNQVGDLYNVKDTGANYVWDGSNWDKLSEVYDLSVFVKIVDLEQAIDALNDLIKIEETE